jgi:hypothetical protein
MDTEQCEIVPATFWRRHSPRHAFFWQRHSPRHVLLFSLSWLVLLGLTLPMLLPHALLMQLSAEWPEPWTFLAVIGMALLLAMPCAAGWALLILALREISRGYFAVKRPLLVLLVVTVFNCFLGAALVVTAVLCKQKRYWFAAAGLASLVCFLLVLLLKFGVLGLTATSTGIWALAWVGLLALLAAVCGCQERRPLHLRCLWPLALAVVYLAGLQAYRIKLGYDLQRGRRELSELVGHSIELRDFLARERRGMPLGEEPLKSLIAAKPDSQAPDVTTASRDEHLAYVEKLRSETPDSVAAVEALVKMPVMGIRLDAPEDWLAASQLAELAAFRQAARYCCSDLAARCDEREHVLSRCADLERLRDWSLSRSTLSAKLVAVAIEKMYLQALARPLAAGTLSDDDWRRLLARKPAWGRAFALAMGDEAAYFQRTVESVLQGDDQQLGENVAAAEAMLTVRHGLLESWWLPRSVQNIILLRDYRFALGWFRNLRYFLDSGGLTTRERADLAEPSRTSLMRHGPHILSAMLLPALSRLHLKHGEIEDQRRLVAIGVAAAVFRRQHGQWPESLDFLPEVPLDAANRLPFLCEQGEIMVRDGHGDSKTIMGFRVYARNADGQDPGGAKAAVAFTIIDHQP